jgi:AraC-like DNA-binding protein
MTVHQVNLFLLLFGALQGLLLSIWFLRNRKKNGAHLYFALFLIVVGLQLTLKVIAKSWMMNHVWFAYMLSYKLPYLVGPLLYLYIKARRENAFKQTDLLHFAPFVVFTFATLVSIFTSGSYNLHVHPYTQAVLQLTQLIVYSALALRLGNTELHGFIKRVVVAEAIIIITLAVMVVYYGRFPDVRLLFLVLTVLIYWISYKAISTPDLFFEGAHATVVPLSLRKTAKYAHSGLKPEEALRIEAGLQQLMSHDKLFLDTTLTIDSLSARIKTSRHHLSQVLNEKLNKTYGDYITELRLQEAGKRLSDPSNLRYTIAAIAHDSGFSAVSGFNEAFRKHYGTTPSKFREQHLNKMSA